MNKIKVACGVIFDENGRVLITQRGDKTNFKKWEFPGGKVKSNETLFETIQREVLEELCIKVKPIEVIFSSYFDKFQLIFIKCELFSGDIILREHLNFKWIKKGEYKNYDFLEGDKEFIKSLKS